MKKFAIIVALVALASTLFAPAAYADHARHCLKFPTRCS